MQDDIQELERKVSDVIAKLGDIDSSRSQPSPPEYQLKHAFWRVDLLSTTTGFTAGDDWDEHFADSSLTQVRTRIETLTGSLQMGMFGNDIARRCRIAWHSEQDFEFPVFVMGSFGRTQLRFNEMPSAPVEYVNNTVVTLRTVRGFNWLQITTNYNMDEFGIFFNVFDTPGVMFRDPLEQDGTLNPLSQVGTNGSQGGSTLPGGTQAGDIRTTGIERPYSLGGSVK